MITNQSLIKFSGLLLSFLLLSSCIKEDFDDCTTDIRFDFSYNMLNSNTFGEQVDEITLYIFDEKGVLLRTLHDEGDHITNDYVIQLTDLPKGNYQFVAWAQSNELTHESANFKFPMLTPGTSTIDEVKATLQRMENNTTFNSNLNNLLVGYVPTRLTDKATHKEVIIPTKKVNNTIRVILIDKSENAITTDDFKVRIEERDGNGIINYNYDVISDGPITYTPFYYEKTTLREDEFDHKIPEEQFNAVATEFAFSRIIENHDIRLIVENKNNEIVVDESLLDLIRLLKSEGYLPDDMTFQEYLDRKDHFSITLYVSGDTSTWLNATIIINGWVINLIDIEL